MGYRWLGVIASAMLAISGVAAPVAQAADDCIYIDAQGNPYHAPCKGEVTTPPDVPPASPPSCVPTADDPCRT